MNSDDRPPPYLPPPLGGPSAPVFPAAFGSQPAAFPGSPYQSVPQTYTGGGDHYYYHGPPGPPGPPGPTGPYLTQPGYQGYHSGAPWTSCPDGERPKHMVFMAEQNRDGGGVGATESCLGACSAALCCCCLWDMLTSRLTGL